MDNNRSIKKVILPLLFSGLFISGLLFFSSCGNQTSKTNSNKQKHKTQAKVQVKTSSIQNFINSFSKKNNNAGILLLTQIKGKTSIYKTGYANKNTKARLNANDLFEIGSASKTFTAIAIMQLIEEGKLSLKTTLNTLYPSGTIHKLAEYKGKNYWNKVTVEMLLNHTTGFIDYLNMYGSDEKTLKVYNNPKKIYTFNDIINIALNHGDANFIPGDKFKYSNTNYIILGDIISKISGTPWRTYIKKHILEKAGLKNTFFGSQMTSTQKERLVTGYYHEEITNIPYTLAGSAGEIVTNVYDLQKYLTYWAEGKFYKKPDTFQKQISTGVQYMYPKLDILKYAMGVIKLMGTIGHAGQTFGFQSYLAINPKTKDVNVILINNASTSSLSLAMNILKLEGKSK